jgi:hypothetical protein
MVGPVHVQKRAKYKRTRYCCTEECKRLDPEDGSILINIMDKARERLKAKVSEIIAKFETAVWFVIGESTVYSAGAKSISSGLLHQILKTNHIARETFELD